MAETKKELIAAERKFLHDLSTPLMVAQGGASVLLEKLKASSANDDQLERLGRVCTALDKIGVMLNARRDFIKSIQE